MDGRSQVWSLNELEPQRLRLKTFLFACHEVGQTKNQTLPPAIGPSRPWKTQPIEVESLMFTGLEYRWLPAMNLALYSHSDSRSPRFSQELEPASVAVMERKGRGFYPR